MVNKKILFVGPKPSDSSTQHPGGQLTAGIGIAEYAKRHGYDFDIIDTWVSSFPPPSLGKKLQLGVKRISLLLKKLAAGGIHGVIILAGIRYGFFERALLSALAGAYGARTLFCIRSGSFIDWMCSSTYTHLLVRRLLAISDCVVVQGARFEKALIESGFPENKLMVVPNWLPQAFDIVTQPKMADTRAPLRLVFVGWLIEEKGLQELLEAFIDLKSRHHIRLDIIGSGTLETELHKQVSDLDLNDIHIHGWMSSIGIKSFLAQAHIFVLPTYLEGFPNALVEAMACGLPAVCSDVGAISDSIQHGVNGFLVPPKDTPALAEAIENYLQNPELIFEHSTATLEIVKKVHDRDANIDKLFSLLR